MARFSAVLNVGRGDASFPVATIPHAIPDPPVRFTLATPEQWFGNDDEEPSAAIYTQVGPNVGNKIPLRFSAMAQTPDGPTTFFERVYVLPPSIDAGIILSPQIIVVDVFNAYRMRSITWSFYDDSAAGDGVDLQNPLPPPPSIIIPRLEGSVHDLLIDTDGPPTIDADIEFGFTTPDGSLTVLVHITGSRSLVFPFEPESPVPETMVWLTRILRSMNGHEQRSSARSGVPRSRIALEVKTKDNDRRYLENLLFDSQDRVFGLPLWYEAVDLVAAISIGALTITVSTTTDVRFVVGGLAIVWRDNRYFESLEIDSLTSTTITFATAFTRAFSAGAYVMPIVEALIADEDTGRKKWVRTLQSDALEFTVVDNGADLSSVSGFSTYTPPVSLQNPNPVARVLLDVPNLMRGETVPQLSHRSLDVIDNGIGAPISFTLQDVSDERSEFGLFTNSRAGLLAVRRLLHALAGRRVSFYAPTFFNDFEVAGTIAPADQVITVVDNDYVNLVRQRQPRDFLRIVKTDGTASAPLYITGSSKPSPGIETISFAPAATGITATVAQVERVELIQRVRLDVDEVTILHENSAGKARIFFPTRTLLAGDDDA